MLTNGANRVKELSFNSLYSGDEMVLISEEVLFK